MKHSSSSSKSSRKIRCTRIFARNLALSLGLAVAGMVTNSAQAAPNVTHNLSAVGDNTWTGATWSNGTPDGTTAGDLVTFGVNDTLTLNANVTIGTINITGSARQMTLNSN